jgi:flavin-dependent dehydrogenase
MDDREATILSRWVIDATGRAGLLARQQRVRPSADLRTIALAAAWDNPAVWELPDVSHTLVESAAWGWGWSVPATQVRRYMTVMLDPTATRAAGAHELDVTYHRHLADLPALGALCRGGRQVTPVFACDASPYHAADPASDGWLAVGDASSFIDPLSSFGVKKALASGWLAAVTLHTCLTRPRTQEAALSLFRARERAYVAAADTALQALSTNTGQHGAFWGARQCLESDETTDHLAARLRAAPDVLAAFAELRTRPTLRLAPGKVQRTLSPLVRGNLVVEEPHLMLAGIDEPIRFLRNVDLLALADLACQHDDVGALFDRYAGTHGPTALPDFLGSLAVLTARGALDFA